MPFIIYKNLAINADTVESIEIDFDDEKHFYYLLIESKYDNNYWYIGKFNSRYGAEQAATNIVCHLVNNSNIVIEDNLESED